jgi:capsular exopolysaccharide synthesis family protein
MSEIFKWLKKTELEQKKAGYAPLGGSLPIETHLETHRGIESAIEDRSTAASADTIFDDFEIRSNATINLDAADYRVKDVWDANALVGEQFRLLRARLNLMQRQRGLKKLLITSAIPGEGKTFVACGLAGVLAQESGKRALLIDGDLRNPAAGRRLGLNENREILGLSDVLNGKADFAEALQSSKESNLFFLPAGKRPANPAELLSSHAFPKLLNGLEERFNWIVIDSPPTILIADISVIAPVCDAILIVVHSNKTAVSMIKACINQIGREKICGIVLNRSKDVTALRYYNSYYRNVSLPPKEND